MDVQQHIRLSQAGISPEDTWALRRISMTLHRWHEAECGNDYGCIERDEVTGKPFWRYSSGAKGSLVPDYEKGALKRLATIMARYPELRSYVQGDPRGASLYILRPGDVPVGGADDAYYNLGIAVYK